VPIVYIQAGVFSATERLLRGPKFQLRKHERVAYWAGKDVGDESVVTTCIAPDAVTTPGSFRISHESNARVVMLLNNLRIVLIAQLHSHPGKWVEHSEGDITGAFMPFERFLSIVVPSYCRDGLLPLTKCGIYRFSKGRFGRLGKSEIENNFRIVPVSCDLQTV
jgi:proteasome lid subunit RPN8/RPN11